MKRYVKSTKASYYEAYTTISHGPLTYGLYYNIIDGKNIEFSMSKVTPYTEGDFVWAQKGLGPKVEFIQNGKTIDSMTLWAYEPSEYQDFSEYADDVLDQVLLELEEFNKNVKSYVDVS